MNDKTNTQPNQANEQAVTSEPSACAIPAPDNKRRIKRLSYTFTALIVLAFISVVVSVGIAVSHFDDDLLLSEGDPYIAKAIVPMMQNAKDRQHAVENWCDILMSKDYFTKWRLAPTDDPKETKINLVLNKAAAELIAAGKEVPQDMVVMFHGTIGWNQIGGREKLADSYISNVVHLFLGDYERKFIPIDKIDNLRWNITDTAKPFYNASNPYIKYTYLTAVFIAAVVAAFTCRLRITDLSLIVAAPSTAFTALAFAAWGNQMLYHPKISELPNIAILLIGAAAGICFVSIASTLKVTTKTRLFCKLILIGAITGLITSSFVHAAIMAFRETTELSGIKGGAGYGIYAGVVIAMLVFAIKSDSINQDPPQPQE